MSRINKPIMNPAEKFIQFKGSTGVFSYWNSMEERREEIPLPIHFLVLDQLATVSGYNEENNCGIYSNEVHNTTEEPLTVRTFKGGIKIKGLYSEIRDRCIAIGGGYTRSVYAALVKNGQITELVNFQFSGAALSAWLKICKKAYIGMIGVKGTTIGIKGAITYKMPVFTIEEIPDPDLESAALELDKKLQEYLAQYKQRTSEVTTPAEAATPVEVAIPIELETLTTVDKAWEDLQKE